MKTIIYFTFLMITGIIRAEEILDVNSRLLTYSANPLPNSPMSTFYSNKNFVMGRLSFQDKYGPILVYWGNNETKKLEGFTYLKVMGTGQSASLGFSCRAVAYNNEKFYLLIGKSNSLENSYGIVLSIIKTKDRKFDMKALELMEGDNALIAYHTDPSFYDKNGLADYRGDEVVAQVKQIMKPSLSIEPLINIKDAKMEISLKGDAKSGAEFEYDFKTKLFKVLSK